MSKYWIQSYFGTRFGWGDHAPCEDTDTPEERKALLALYSREMPQYLHRLVYKHDGVEEVVAI